MKSNFWLCLGVLGLAIFPLVMIKNADFSGADSQAKDVIQEIQPEYKPWFQPLIKPASSEVESLLFAVQAAGGAGVVGYVIGLYQGRSQKRFKDEK